VWVRTLRKGTAVRPRRHAGPHPATPHARSVPTDSPAGAGTFYARTDTAAANLAAGSDHHARADPSPDARTDADADSCANA